MEIKKRFISDEYIVLPRVRKFCSKHQLGSINSKEDGILKIEEFASQSNLNEEEVNKWIHSVVKEGRKYCYIKQIKSNERINMFKSEVYWKKFINNEFPSGKMIHINEAKFKRDLEIQNIKLKKNSDNIITNVYFTIGLLVYEAKKDYCLDKVIYPIFVELNVLDKILEIRIKSKTKIYKIKGDTGAFEERVGDKVTTDKIASETVRFLKTKLEFEEEDIHITKANFFQSYYKMLDELTQTPDQIVDTVKKQKNAIESFAKSKFRELDLTHTYLSMAIDDLNIWMEKFISLSEKDKTIFTENKDGYPIKLIATDSDDTRVEESSGDMEPLQTKSSYFDHKKIFHREKLCDGISFAFKRIDCLYYGSEPFVAMIFYKNGFGIINFPQYVEEEDIQNVLSRIIENL